MKKDYVLGILFFSGLWGISEAVLGGALYKADVPHASVILTIIGFVILSFAHVYFPQKGTATLIAVCAMLYKFLNAPFFACHLLGIALIGICYDLFLSVFKIKNKSVCALTSCYLSYVLFALMITYVFRYEHWLGAGFGKLLRYVGISGSLAALGCAMFVPLGFLLGERLKAKLSTPFKLQLKLTTGGVSLVTVGLWIFGLAVFFLNF